MIWLTKDDMRSVDRAIAYIQLHYRERISSVQLSFEQHLSARKLQAGLRVRTGATLHPYLLQVRIDQARALLSDTNLTIKQIVFDTGFRTLSHFGEKFKEATAESPAHYRQTHDK